MKKAVLFTTALALIAAGATVGAPQAIAVTHTEVVGLSPTAPAIIVGGEGTVYDPAGNTPAWYATAEAYDTGTAAQPSRPIYGGYVTHWDGDGYSVPSQIISTNRGVTFSTTSQGGYEASTRLDDGRVVRADFLGQTNGTLQQRMIKVRYSGDDGASFTTTINATVNIAPQTFSGLSNSFIPTSLVQVPNGPLLMAGYAGVRDSAGNGVYSSLLMQSVTAGQSWTLRSTIAQGTTARGYSETAIVIASNGDLLAVMRSSTYDNLWKRRSTTMGTGWTTAQQGIPEFAIDTNGNRPFGRINPRLALLPNGILALVAGRPDNHIALSYDGTGNAWNVKKMFYDNHSIQEPQDLNEGTSGNADFVWSEANRAIMLADTCHAISKNGIHYNKCTWQGGTMSGNTTQYQIKRVAADILTAGAGKVDLAGKAIVLGGDMTDAIPGHARTGVRGAVDGSNEMWSSAVKSGGPGTFDVTLDRAYTLSKAGLSLAVGGAESATVQTKLHESDPWSDWYTVTDQKSYALKYVTPGPRQAQYVRVVTGTSSFCPPGVAAPCSMLNEIELYADDVDSFENDPVNGIPRGYSLDFTVDDQGVNHQGVWVSQSNSGSTSHRVLRIVDDSVVHLPAVRRSDSSSTVKTLEFRFHPDQWRPVGQGASSAMLFDVLATPVAGARRSAFHLALWYDGTIRYYASGSWHQIGAAPVFNPATACSPTCVWTTIRIRATTTLATVSVDGTAIGTATRFDGATSNLTGHQFAASSTLDANESFVVDDVFTSNS